ncbi:kin of IRRE-like protein 2 isoform X3 [Mercenaria mercenaria]|uniref:kin of IRRE-like protein 2 isoform X3 n=1 Tax=Mercenaria mercenaria TaxID=6596 RepID=UPI00234EFC9E|nr:kin of IRRE-like protein 2 isoform X3 [Mercenaria mercenaria]
MFRCFRIYCIIIILLHCEVVDSTEDYYRHFPSPIPSFLPVPTSITVQKGETAHLRCRIHNLGTKTVVWRKITEEFPLTVGKRLFTPSRNIKIETEAITGTEVDEDRYELIIKDITEDQAGIYECQVSATEKYTKNITLHVLDPAKYKPELYGTQYVSIMENIHLTCNATGTTKTPDGVDWFFNGEIITEMNPRWQGRLVEINKKPLPGRSLISELIIERATIGDRGHYVCRLTKHSANGLKVHILNDKKNYKNPKRDNTEKLDSSYSKQNSGASCWNFLQVSCITTLCYFISFITQQ